MPVRGALLIDALVQRRHVHEATARGQSSSAFITPPRANGLITIAARYCRELYLLTSKSGRLVGASAVVVTIIFDSVAEQGVAVRANRDKGRVGAMEPRVL